MDPLNEAFDAWRKSPDPERIVRLLRVHQGRLYNIAFQVLLHRQDAEDAVQETFLDIISSIREIVDPIHFRRWSARVALHTALNIKEKRRVRRERELSKGAVMQSADPNPAMREAVLEAIGALDDAHRSLILDYYCEKRTLEDIAREWDCSAVAIWKRLGRAKARLMERLAVGSAATASALGAVLESLRPERPVRDLVTPAVAAGAAASIIKAAAAAPLALAVSKSAPFLVGSGVKTAMVCAAFLIAAAGYIGHQARRQGDPPAVVAASTKRDMKSPAPLPAPAPVAISPPKRHVDTPSVVLQEPQKAKPTSTPKVEQPCGLPRKGRHSILQGMVTLEGKPHANCTVKITFKNPEKPSSGRGRPAPTLIYSARSDDQGRYEIRGDIPPGSEGCDVEIGGFSSWLLGVRQAGWKKDRLDGDLRRPRCVKVSFRNNGQAVAAKHSWEWPVHVEAHMPEGVYAHPLSAAAFSERPWGEQDERWIEPAQRPAEPTAPTGPFTDRWVWIRADVSAVGFHMQDTAETRLKPADLADGSVIDLAPASVNASLVLSGVPDVEGLTAIVYAVPESRTSRTTYTASGLAKSPVELTGLPEEGEYDLTIHVCGTSKDGSQYYGLHVHRVRVGIRRGGVVAIDVGPLAAVAVDWSPFRLKTGDEASFIVPGVDGSTGAQLGTLTSPPSVVWLCAAPGSRVQARVNRWGSVVGSRISPEVLGTGEATVDARGQAAMRFQPPPETPKKGKPVKAGR